MIAQSMAASSKAVGWSCWCSLGVGASLGFVLSVILGDRRENVTDNPAVKAVEVAKALRA